MFKKQTRKIIILIAVVGLLIFLHLIRVLAPVESFITSIFRPLFSGFYSVSSNLRISYDEQTNKQDLVNLVNRLEIQINQLEVENAKLKILKTENRALRQHLKFFTENELRFMMANIISRNILGNPIAQSHSIVIDKGSRDGLFPGLAVVSSTGIIIGKIVMVKDYLSEVYLTTNKACKLAAAIQSQDKTSGIAEGELGLTIKMNFIPQTEEIKIGDSVVTSGLEQNIPRGLVIGKVTQISKESNELWQSATIEPLVDLDKLIIVSVLLPQ